MTPERHDDAHSHAHYGSCVRLLFVQSCLTWVFTYRLQQSQARSTEFVNVLESMNIPKNSSQEDVVGGSNIQNLTYEPETIEVNPSYTIIADTHTAPTAEEQQNGREENRQDRNSAALLNSESDIQRDLPLSRRSNNIRSQTKSVSGLEELIQENDKAQFSRQMSVRHDSHSRAAKTGIEQFPKSQHAKSARVKMPLSDGASNFPTAAPDDSYYPRGSMDRNEKFSIHQVKSTNTQEDNRIEITSPYADIPGFKDPEITGNDDDDKDDLLKLPPPPDIYSSQILSTPDQHEDDQDNFDTYDVLAQPIHEVKHQYSSLNRIISVQPPANDSDGRL